MPIKLDDYRLLGRSGLRVSPLSLGTMTFGQGEGSGWGSSDAEAKALVDRYVDGGGNFLDTANFYGAQGGSERVLAPLIAGRRDRLVIATKYTLTTSPGDPNASGNHRKNMMQAVEASLKRLGTDYIDLYYLHMWDFRTPVDEVLRAFDDLVRQGKILYAGLSDTPAWQGSRMQAIAELRGWTQFAGLQIPYSLAERTVERDLMPMALEMGMGVLPWGPLAGGILSGKYSRADLEAKPSTDFGAVTSRKDINVSTGKLTARALDIADVVKEVAGEIGRSPAQVALAWTLLHPAVVSPLIGVRNVRQLDDNLAALDIALDADQVRRLEAVSAIEPGFPADVLNGPSMDFMLGFVKVPRRERG